MLKHIKTLLKGNIVLISIGITIGIIYLSLIKVPTIPLQITHLDKYQHAFAYFTLTMCWLLSFHKKTPNRKYTIVFACIIFGIILEVLQYKLTQYRTGDYLDILANTVGVVLALMVFNQFLKKKNELINHKDLHIT